MAQTLFEKLWQSHVVRDFGSGSALVYIDRIFLHERTGSVALKSLEETGRSVRNPEQVFGTMDHIIDTLPDRSDVTLMPSGTSFITAMRNGCKWAGIKLFDINDADQGIAHVISPEKAIVLPGLTLVCPDSHTCSQGAFGALVWGIGSSEAEHALATSCLRVSKPKTMRVTLEGSVLLGTSAKDIILHLIANIGAAGGRGYAIEFCGDAIGAMDMEARMTLCNMAVELSAFTAIIAPDEKTIAYLKGREYAPKDTAWTHATTYWASLVSDAEAMFDAEITLDVSSIGEMVSWGTSPEHSCSVEGIVPFSDSFTDVSKKTSYEKARTYMDVKQGQRLKEIQIDSAFIGSCTNGRLADLRAAATILKGHKIAPHVKAICVPGSMQVKADAEAEGLDKIFIAAGVEWRLPGCSMCFYAGGESFGKKVRVISTTNRNFENRQGPGTRTHIASPATVAASAIMGRVASVRDLKK